MRITAFGGGSCCCIFLGQSDSSDRSDVSDWSDELWVSGLFRWVGGYGTLP